MTIRINFWDEEDNSQEGWDEAHCFGLGRIMCDVLGISLSHGTVSPWVWLHSESLASRMERAERTGQWH